MNGDTPHRQPLASPSPQAAPPRRRSTTQHAGIPLTERRAHHRLLPKGLLTPPRLRLYEGKGDRTVDSDGRCYDLFTLLLELERSDATAEFVEDEELVTKDELAAAVRASLKCGLSRESEFWTLREEQQQKIYEIVGFAGPAARR